MSPISLLEEAPCKTTSGHWFAPTVPIFSSRLWARLLAAIIIFGSAAARIGYLTSPAALELSQDEAHYWDWSRHLDSSYYSKGPVVAYLIRGSCEATELFFGDLPNQSTLPIRLPAVICGCLMLAGLYVLISLVYGQEMLALAAVAATTVFPPFAAMTMLMTIDAPFLCCWCWALVFGYLALFRNRNWAWPAAGAMIAVGFLAKQTMVLWIPSLVLFIFFTPSRRQLFARSGFWIMTLIAALGSLPMLWWNSRHDWLTFRHLLGHTGFKPDEPDVYWLGPLQYLCRQVGLLLGYWFVVWCGAMWTQRPGRNQRDDITYLWWMSLPTFLFFLGFSWKNGGGGPIWPAAGYVSGLVLAIGWLGGLIRRNVHFILSARAWLVLFLSLECMVTILLHDSTLVFPLLSRLSAEQTAEQPTPIRRFDPTCRLRGWRTLAAEVDKTRHELTARGIDALLAGDRWSLPGIIGFYCEGKPAVCSLGPIFMDRCSQYDLWRPNPVADPDEFRGKTFILVAHADLDQSAVFEEIEERRVVTHWESGQAVAQWVIYVGRGYRGPGDLVRGRSF